MQVQQRTLTEHQIFNWYHLPAEYDGPSADYIPVNRTVMFGPNTVRGCIMVPIIDNVQTEQPEESFDVTLTRTEDTPDRVVLTRHEAEVTIEDDDSEMYHPLATCFKGNQGRISL